MSKSVRKILNFTFDRTMGMQAHSVYPQEKNQTTIVATTVK